MSQSNSQVYVPPANLKARLAASYDSIADTYNAWTERHATPRMIQLQTLLKHLPPSDHGSEDITVLELGAGAGLPTAKALLDHDPRIHVVANDLSGKQIDLLRHNLAQYGSRVEASVGDMLSLDVDPASVDAIVAMYSIIHLPRDEQTELAGKMIKWLKPGGLLLANFAEEASEESIMENWLGKGDRKGGWVYWSAWGAEGSVKMMEDAGLEILEKTVVSDVVDATFLWILARKSAGRGLKSSE